MKTTIVIAAMVANDVSLLEILHDKFDLTKLCSSEHLTLAAIFGSLDALMYFHVLDHPGFVKAILNSAARNGHLNIVIFLHANRTEGCTYEAMDGAAGNGHLDILQWLDANRTEGCSGDAMDLAAYNGHLAVIQWLHERGYPSGGRAMPFAAGSCRLEIMEWLHTHRYETCPIVHLNASAPMERTVQMIQWLCVNRSDIDPQYFVTQAILLDLSYVIQLLVDQFGLPWSAQLTQEALYLDRVNILHWVHSKHPRTIESVDQVHLERAINKRDLPMVQWLCEAAQLKFTANLLHLATAMEWEDVLLWLVETKRIDHQTIQEYRNKPYVPQFVWGSMS
ncbi:unnamed protein product [Aphanomyces euteiches]